MDELQSQLITRRNLQRLLLIAPAPLAAVLATGKCSGIALSQQSDGTPTSNGGPILAPTPRCGDDDELDITAEQTEGPFYTPNSPERTSLLEPEYPGRELHLTGYVYSPDCTPIDGALVDFWHCDDNGNYDNEGYRFRGHQFTDVDGRYELTSIIPGLYPGRTRHIHVKVQAPKGPILTSQLYFPDEPDNATDGIFNERLVVDIEAEDNWSVAFFTFVVEEAA